MRDPGRPSLPPTEKPVAHRTSAVQGSTDGTSVVQGPRPQYKAASAVQGSTSAVQTLLVPGYEGKPCTTGVASQWEVVKFATAHGRPGKLSESEFATWACRLDVESGRVRPYHVGANPLPVAVSPIARTSYDGFVHLLSCRWAVYPVAPAPWEMKFAAAWCGIPARLAKDARLQLVRMNALIHVEDCGPLKLWLPWGVDA